MKRLLLGTILCFLSACVSTGTPLPDELTYQEEGDRAYLLACNELELQCDFPPPTVVVSPIVDDLNWGSLNGVYYWDDVYVFISPTAKDISKTIIHETAHYVMWMEGLRPNVCVAERTVRAIAGQEWEPFRGIYGCDENDEVLDVRSLL